MIITNAQIKALIDIYLVINNAQKGYITISDISNKQKIKRFEKVLNELIKEKIIQNEDCNQLYTTIRKELKNNENRE